MRSICVFCGSGKGRQVAYEQTAIALGHLLAQKHIRLVYGGAQIGLMGAVADAALAAGGEVTGVIPHFLSDKEVMHHHLTELVMVESMHERKKEMANRSDGFIAMPGGIGTLEELFEIFSWDYLRLHNKPVGILNVDGFYDRLLEFMQYSVAEGFLKQPQIERLLVASDAATLLQMMAARASVAGTIIDSSRT